MRNSVSREARDIKACSKEAFKAVLDKYLKTIPDKPQIPGYVTYRRADIVDMAKLSVLDISC